MSYNYRRPRVYGGPCSKCGVYVGAGGHEMSQEYDNGARYKRAYHSAERCAKRAASNAAVAAHNAKVEAERAAQRAKWDEEQAALQAIKARMDAGLISQQEARAELAALLPEWFPNG